MPSSRAVIFLDFPQPNDHGYDYWMSTHNNASPSHKNPDNFIRNGKPVGKVNAFSAPFVADEAIHWLKEIRDTTKPFALSVWVHEPHHPIATDKPFLEPYGDDPKAKYYGNITQLDYALGRVMDALGAQGLADNTLFIFTSDNGPEGGAAKGGSTGGLSGRKRDDLEGGIRVPGIVRWPGHIEPGSVSAIPVIGSDIFTTVLEAAGVAIPADRTIDGVSMVPAFAGNPVECKVPLFWRTHVSDPACRVAIRVGDWKLVANDAMDQFQLFNISNDAKELNNLAAEMPEKLDELKITMFDVWNDIQSEGPSEWWLKSKAKPKGKNGTVPY